MKIATFNVENMFERAKAMSLETWADGKEVLEDYQRLNALIQSDVYSDDIKDELLTIMKRHKGLMTNGASKYIRLRDIRGKLLKKPKGGAVQIGPEGRSGWIGWFDLEREPVKETATENTARIIQLIEADVLCVVEAENRVGLRRFNEDVMPRVDAKPYRHVMLIDGNDDRGIDVGILTKNGYPISTMRSHVDDEDDEGVIFSRDCAEYEVETPEGNTILLLVNHFKSKGYGDPAQSAAKRRRQAERVRQIYDERISEYPYIAVLGDLNETPDQSPMDPLLRNGSSLVDVMAHPKFVGDGRPGTHGNGTKGSKLDYLLMSPALADSVVGAGIERRGVWGGKNGTLFPHLPTIKVKEDAASDHAALWVEVDC